MRDERAARAQRASGQMDQLGRAITDRNVVGRNAMASGEAGSQIAGVRRRIARDKRGRVMICGERLWRRPIGFRLALKSSTPGGAAPP